MRTTLGSTAFAVAANALERFFATSGDCVRGVTAAAKVMAGGAAGALAAGGDFPARMVEDKLLPSQEPAKLAIPTAATTACFRNLILPDSGL